MKLKVRLDFSDEQRQVIEKFLEDFNASLAPHQWVNLDKLCKNAVLHTIKQAYQLAEQAEEQSNGTHDTASRDTSGDITEAQPSKDTDSNALSLKKDTADSDK